MKIITKTNSFTTQGSGSSKKVVSTEIWKVKENRKERLLSENEKKEFETLFSKHTSGLKIDELISFDVYETSKGKYSGICNYRQNRKHQQYRFKSE